MQRALFHLFMQRDEGRVKEGVCWQQPDRLCVWLMSDGAIPQSSNQVFHLPHHWQWKTIHKPFIRKSEMLILVKEASGQTAPEISPGPEFRETNPTKAGSLCQALPPSQSKWNLNGRAHGLLNHADSPASSCGMCWEANRTPQVTSSNIKPEEG